MFQCAFEHRSDRHHPGVLLALGRVDAAAVHTDPQRTIVLAGDVDKVPHLVLPRLLTLVVVQVAGIVADLVDVRRHGFGQPIVLLQVDRQIGRRTPADLGQRFGIGSAVHGDPDHVSAGFGQALDLLDGRLHIARARGRHALHGDGMITADRNRPDRHGARRISLYHHKSDSTVRLLLKRKDEARRNDE